MTCMQCQKKNRYNAWNKYSLANSPYTLIHNPKNLPASKKTWNNRARPNPGKFIDKNKN